jgi:copper(I)-binding protein
MVGSTSVGSVRRSLAFVLPGVVLAVVLVVGVVLWQGPPVGPPELSVVASGATPTTMGDESSIYLWIDNDGAADRLISASSDQAATVTLHTTEVSDDGGGLMTDRSSLVVPERGRLALGPGGDHLMAHQAMQPFEPGDMVGVTMVFETSGTLTVQVPVRPLVELAELRG